MISEKQLKNKLKIAGALGLLLLSILVGRLWHLQIRMGQEYEVLSRNNRIKLLPIEAPRGLIRDRNGVILADTRFAATVSVVPMDLKNADQVIGLLSEIIDMDPEEIEGKIKALSGRPFEPVRIKRDIPPEMVIEIEERRIDLPGVMVEQLPMRHYVKGSLSAHTLGYVGEINDKELKELRDKGYAVGDVVGKIGIEKEFEDALRGTKGVQYVEVNALSRPVRVLGQERPIPGKDVYLTIDSRLQETVEKILQEEIEELRKDPKSNAKGGAMILADPKTGEILAMASFPSYDLNLFVKGISLSDWKGLIEDPYNPLFNRVMSGEYSPGSIFKIFTAFAALQEGLVKPGEIFYCSGSDPVISEKKCQIWYDTRRGHGNQTLEEAIKNSCNVVFYELGRRLGVDKLAEYSMDMGFGTSAGLQVWPGDKSGLVPTKKWKLEKRSQRWIDPTETMDFSIGQGFFNTTLIQLAMAYSTLANGGTLYSPMIVKKIMTPDLSETYTLESEVVRIIPISPYTDELLRKGMRRVTVDGTARAAFRDFPIPVCGKTGTAEVGGGGNHAWFAAFSPDKDPQVVVIVLVEDGGYGGKNAAPIARRALEAYFQL